MITAFVRRACALSLLAVGHAIFATAAFAQFGPRPVVGAPILANPPTPQIQPLPTGVLHADFGAPQSITLRWYQPLVVSSQAPVEASHFVICVYSPTQACQWPSNPATPGVWSGSATDISFATRTPQYNASSPFISNLPRMVIGYSYTKTISLDNSFYDRQLKWTVGACASQSTGACTFVSPASAFYSTKELHADMSFQYSKGRVLVTAEAGNGGTTSADNFETWVAALPALVGASGACATDPNEPGLTVQLGAQFITRDGRTPMASDFWNGTRYNVGMLDIVGIAYDLNSFFGSGTNSLPAHTSSNGTITPTKTPRLYPMVTVSVLPSDVPVQVGQAKRFGLVAIASIDSPNRITEVNEGNNVSVKCRDYSR